MHDLAVYKSLYNAIQPFYRRPHRVAHVRGVAFQLAVQVKVVHDLFQVARQAPPGAPHFAFHHLPAGSVAAVAARRLAAAAATAARAAAAL